MKKTKQDMCPLFPDVPCPKGKDSAEACMVRLESNYDPMIDFKDYLFMNCALQRAHEKDKKESESRD